MSTSCSMLPLAERQWCTVHCSGQAQKFLKRYKITNQLLFFERGAHFVAVLSQKLSLMANSKFSYNYWTAWVVRLAAMAV